MIRTKKQRQGAHLVLRGPKVAPTSAYLVSRTAAYEVEPDTPEAFRNELAHERKYDAMLSPLQRMHQGRRR